MIRTTYKPTGFGSMPVFGLGLLNSGSVSSPYASLCTSGGDPQCPCTSGDFVSAHAPGGQGAQLALSLSSIGAAAGTSAIAATIAGSSLAVPVIGAAIAGVTALIGFFVNKNRVYHQQEAATTHIVDEAEQLMKQNLAGWQSSTKTVSAQQVALQNFCQLWNEVVKACNVSQYGDPGQRCYHDRQRGGKWDWFSYYYEPIASDPNVAPDPTPAAVQTAISSIEKSFGVDPASVPTWLVPVGLAAILLLVLS